MATVDDCVEAVTGVANLAFPRWNGDGWKFGLKALDGFFSQCDRRKRELLVAWGTPPDSIIATLFAHQIVHALGIDGHGARFRERLERAAQQAESHEGGADLARDLREHVGLYVTLDALVHELTICTPIMQKCVELARLITDPEAADRSVPQVDPEDFITRAEVVEAFARVRAAAFPSWDATGWKVVVRRMPGLRGKCFFRSRTIAVVPNMPRDTLDAVVVHEIVHAVAGLGHGAAFQEELLQAQQRARAAGLSKLVCDLDGAREQVKAFDDFTSNYARRAGDYAQLTEHANMLIHICKQPTEARRASKPK